MVSLLTKAHWGQISYMGCKSDAFNLYDLALGGNIIYFWA